MPALQKPHIGKPKKLTGAKARPQQNMGRAGAKIARAKNKQALARLAAHKARLQARRVNPAIVAAARPQHLRPRPKSPPVAQVTKVNPAAKVYLTYTTVVWFMGIARYYTMPAQVIGYITALQAAQHTATVYIPRPAMGGAGQTHTAALAQAGAGLQCTYHVINPGPAPYNGIAAMLAAQVKARKAAQAAALAKAAQVAGAKAAKALLTAQKAQAQALAAATKQAAALAAKAQKAQAKAAALAAAPAPAPKPKPQPKPKAPPIKPGPKPKPAKYKPGLKLKKPPKYSPAKAALRPKAKALLKAAQALAALQAAQT